MAATDGLGDLLELIRDPGKFEGQLAKFREAEDRARSAHAKLNEAQAAHRDEVRLREAEHASREKALAAQEGTLRDLQERLAGEAEALAKGRIEFEGHKRETQERQGVMDSGLRNREAAVAEALSRLERETRAAKAATEAASGVAKQREVVLSAREVEVAKREGALRAKVEILEKALKEIGHAG